MYTRRLHKLLQDIVSWISGQNCRRCKLANPFCEEQLGKCGTFEIKTTLLSFAVRVLLETEVEDNLDFLLAPI